MRGVYIPLVAVAGPSLALAGLLLSLVVWPNKESTARAESGRLAGAEVEAGKRGLCGTSHADGPSHDTACSGAKSCWDDEGGGAIR